MTDKCSFCGKCDLDRNCKAKTKEEKKKYCDKARHRMSVIMGNGRTDR